MLFGVIGGTGFYKLAEEPTERLEVVTPYGPVAVNRVRSGEADVAFVARHGAAHSVPPHRVNYRANIASLQQLGVRNILATAAVGSMEPTMPPGALAAMTQFLDFTRTRASTFFDGSDGAVRHVDMSEPYCPHLREELRAAAAARGQELTIGATYVCVEGPRFETPAEIRMFRSLGGDLVGMTNVPEVVLAREAGICYAAVAVVTNWAAGVSAERVVHEEVSDFISAQADRVRGLLQDVIAHHVETDCSCRAWAQS